MSEITQSPELKQLLDNIRSRYPGVTHVSVFTPVDGPKTSINIEVAGYVDPKLNPPGVLVFLDPFKHDQLTIEAAKIVDTALSQIGTAELPQFLSDFYDDPEDDPHLLRTIDMTELPAYYAAENRS